MAKYVVNLKEVWVQPVHVDAVDEDDARRKVLDGEGDMNDTATYSYTLDGDDAVQSVEYVAGSNQ